MMLCSFSGYSHRILSSHTSSSTPNHIPSSTPTKNNTLTLNTSPPQISRSLRVAFSPTLPPGEPLAHRADGRHRGARKSIRPLKVLTGGFLLTDGRTSGGAGRENDVTGPVGLRSVPRGGKGQCGREGGQRPREAWGRQQSRCLDDVQDNFKERYMEVSEKLDFDGIIPQGSFPLGKD